METIGRAVPAALRVERTAAWANLVRQQSGAVGSRQLRRMGVDWNAIATQVDAQRWQHPVHGVYVTFTGPLPRATRIAVALVYGGAKAVLSHRTAAEEWEMLPKQDGPVHITVPYGSSAVSQGEMIKVHRSRAYRHIVVAADPPRTSRADTAIDVAVEEPDARSARRVLTDLLTSGGVRPVQVEQQLGRRPPRRYRRALAAAVDLVRHGVQSVLEEQYAVEVEQAHGIPPARRQRPFAVDGVTLYEDATYDHIGVPLTVRLDGRTHLRAGTAFRDRRRDNAAELAGRSRLTFGWRDLSGDPCGGAAEVATVLQRWGWRGEVRRCAQCIGRA
ncbi:MAG TPA: hypothetical protein VEZ42_12335 [Pseudonocardia sp.]|nr:hypothetical protein [Pseudonocardia sp.]